MTGVVAQFVCVCKLEYCLVVLQSSATAVLRMFVAIALG